MAWFGMIIIGLTQIIPFIEKRYSLNELLIVMSWVFMWTAIDLIFFKRIELLREKKKYIKMYFSEIIVENNLMNQ